MFTLRSDKVLFCDVDDTLVVWDKQHATYVPHLAHIRLIKRFHARNQPVIVWSAGGYEWAEKIVRELGLEKYVTAVLSKPSWWMDDLPADEVLLKSGYIYLKNE